MENRIEQLINLLQKLNHSVNEYFLAYKDLKKSMKLLSESENKSSNNNEIEKAKLKKADAERRIEAAKEEVISLLNKIDELFNEGYFKPMNEEMKNEVDDEYMELVNSMKAIEESMLVPSTKKCSDIVEMHKILLEDFAKLEGNITVYNKKAESENWDFKFISPEDAHQKYNDMSKHIHDNWEKEFEKRKQEGFVYQRP